jgi:hypothetical protein
MNMIMQNINAGIGGNKTFTKKSTAGTILINIHSYFFNLKADSLSPILFCTALIAAIKIVKSTNIKM